MSQRLSRYDSYFRAEANNRIAIRSAQEKRQRMVADRFEEEYNTQQVRQIKHQDARNSGIDSVHQNLKSEESQADRFKLLCRKALAILTVDTTVPIMTAGRKRKHSVSSGTSSSSTTTPSSPYQPTPSISPPYCPPQSKKPKMTMEDLLSSKRTLPTIYCPKAKTPKPGLMAASKPLPKKPQMTPIEMALAKRKEQEEMEIESQKRHEVLIENRRHRDMGRLETINVMREYRRIQFNKAQEAKITGVFQGEMAPKKKKTRARKQFWEKD